MALRRALVVDDSLSAQLALKKQLEAHDLSVNLACSGEEAIEFLKGNTVDVVFMDHVMPGMDGLEAVSALKSNPATATTPVMMYTSKEGELYVSQARALGAVDVLPKQVQPGVLFGMLLKLGLVRDRRTPEGEAGDAPTDTAVDAPTDVAADKRIDDREQRPTGMAMSKLLTRILEDQHSALRTDILQTHRDFAKQVASEVYEQQQADQLQEVEIQPPRAERPIWPMLTGALAVIVVLVGGLFLQARSEREDLRDELDRVVATVEQERMSSLTLAEQMQSSLSEVQGRSDQAMEE